MDGFWEGTRYWCFVLHVNDFVLLSIDGIIAQLMEYLGDVFALTDPGLGFMFVKHSCSMLCLSISSIYVFQQTVCACLRVYVCVRQRGRRG